VLPYKGDRPTVNQVGLWLRKRKDKVFGDWQLLGRLDRNGVGQWKVRGVRGVAGGTSSSRARNGNDASNDSLEGLGRNTPRDPPHPPQKVDPEPEAADEALDEVEF
jgi:hypothetical protein